MVEAVSAPLLLRPSPTLPLDVLVKIPSSNDNLFERLIRNPQAPDRPMRETQCSEMLRAVLVSCPTLKLTLMKWLAQLLGVPTAVIDELEWTLETEQSIGSKRDDLRIEGWKITDEQRQRFVLWSVEVKVAASFHESSQQDWDDDEAPVIEDDPNMVNQVVNYDQWLSKEAAEFRAGFVLAINDLTKSLPATLSETWRCLTWTQLAEQTESMLTAELLPATEQPFAQHMLGFIRHRLWDTTDMDDSRLELDDVALLRALAAIGQSCSQKIRGLVNQFEQILKGTGANFVDIRMSTPRFFHRADGIEYGVSARCTNNESGEISLSAKVVVDQVKVTIGTYPKGCVANQKTREILNRFKDQLTHRHADWVFFGVDESEYRVAEISKPLISVLAEDDWESPLMQFVQDAVNDVKELGLLATLLNIKSTVAGDTNEPT